MGKLHFALLLWEQRQDLARWLLAALVLLALLASCAAGGTALFLATVPLVTTQQVETYKQVAQEQTQVGGLDWRELVAVDGARRGQDFGPVTAATIESLAGEFVRCWTVRVPLAGGGTTLVELCTRRTLAQVMDHLGFDEEQRQLAGSYLRTIASPGFAVPPGGPANCPPAFTPSPGAALAWPLPGGTLTSCFGPRPDPVTGGQDLHSGVDIAAPAGTPVLAAQAGTVTFAGWHGDYGNLVVVRHQGDLWTWYGHLAAIQVAPGQALARGAALGTVGSTGKSTGPHLHFEVRPGGEPVDPLPYYRAQEG